MPNHDSIAVGRGNVCPVCPFSLACNTVPDTVSVRHCPICDRYVGWIETCRKNQDSSKGPSRASAMGQTFTTMYGMRVSARTSPYSPYGAKTDVSSDHWAQSNALLDSRECMQFDVDRDCAVLIRLLATRENTQMQRELNNDRGNIFSTWRCQEPFACNQCLRIFDAVQNIEEKRLSVGCTTGRFTDQKAQEDARVTLIIDRMLERLKKKKKKKGWREP
jgi:hypothetical protein